MIYANRVRRLEQEHGLGRLCVKIEGVAAGCDCGGRCVLDGKPDVFRVHLDAQGHTSRQVSVLLDKPKVR